MQLYELQFNGEVKLKSDDEFRGWIYGLCAVADDAPEATKVIVAIDKPGSTGKRGIQPFAVAELEPLYAPPQAPTVQILATQERIEEISDKLVKVAKARKPAKEIAPERRAALLERLAKAREARKAQSGNLQNIPHARAPEMFEKLREEAGFDGAGERR